MAAMGDSISAALFAGTSLDDSTATVTVDEVTASWRGWSFFERKDTLSWSSGKDINSHYMRLRDYLKSTEGLELEVINTAATGNRAEDLLGQARQVADAMRSGEYRALKYVTLMVGANDVCSGETAEGTPSGVMRGSIKAALAVLAAVPQQEPVRVLVSGIPNVPTVSSFRNEGIMLGLTCGGLWVRAGICDGMLGWSNESELHQRVDIVRGRNDVIKQAVAEAALENPNLKLHYTERIFNQTYVTTDMAVDCFHPNERSQRRIAEELWKEQVWFPPTEEVQTVNGQRLQAAGERVGGMLGSLPSF
ncbi:MAG: hypothetical protein HYZ75_09915 [Elusimicrobia bacterium]|nr:hypothetical protein [Elusimicrobiota bacterium]